MNSSLPENLAVHIFSDGACSPNPGHGGWGAIIKCAGQEAELSGGFRETTNNRMELMAAIAGLEHVAALPQRPASVTLVTDSAYVVNAVERGWLNGWHRKNYRRFRGDTGEELVPNYDLWQRFRALLRDLPVTLQHVRGHAGHPENERCDQIAVKARQHHPLPPDEGYENPPAPPEAAEQPFAS